MGETLSLCVFCGSSAKASPFFMEQAYRFGEMLAERGVRLVYGGGNVGMMGRLADGCLAQHGRVLGVLPHFFHSREVAHPGLTELRIVSTMQERKLEMAREADGFVILPGGFGTLDEMFEVVTWRQLGLHHKPMILVNLHGYWTALGDMFSKMQAEGFVGDQLYQEVDRLEAVFPALSASGEFRKINDAGSA